MIEKRIKAGNIITVSVYPHTKPSPARSHRQEPSTSNQKRKNNRRARKALSNLINANFDSRDVFLTLTISDEHDLDLAALKKHVRYFLRRLRKIYAEMGYDEPKFIYVIEKASKFHIHMILNYRVPFEDTDEHKKLQEIWPLGYIHADNLWDIDDYQGLADYFLKSRSSNPDESETITERYVTSRNLTKPDVEISSVPASAIGTIKEFPGYSYVKGSEYRPSCDYYPNFYYEYKLVMNKPIERTMKNEKNTGSNIPHSPGQYNY